MEAVLIVFALTATMALAIDGNTYTTCRELPKNLTHDDRKYVEPFGRRWKLYKSNIPTETCFNFEYKGNRNFNASQGTFTMYNEKADFFVEFKVEMTASKTSWIFTGDNGVDMLYYKLLLNDFYHYMCIYSCDKQNEYAIHILCAAVSDEGRKELDKELANKFPKLPLKSNETLGVVYNDDCKVNVVHPKPPRKPFICSIPLLKKLFNSCA